MKNLLLVVAVSLIMSGTSRAQNPVPDLNLSNCQILTDFGITPANLDTAAGIALANGNGLLSYELQVAATKMQEACSGTIPSFSSDAEEEIIGPATSFEEQYGEDF